MPGLALTKLTLSHFRSHQDARLELDGGPIAIHGPNGTGKTNILEAVSLFSPGRGLRRAAIDEMAMRPCAIGWKLTGILSSRNQVRELSTSAEPDSARQVTIDGKTATQTALGRIARTVWLTPPMDRLWIEGADGRRRFLDRIALTFNPGHAENALNYEKAMRERNRLLKDQVRDPSWYNALEARMSEAGSALQDARRAAVARLVEAQAGAETAFPAVDIKLIAAEGGATPETAEDFAEALAANRHQDLNAGRSLIGPHRTDLDAAYSAKGMPARQCSTGEQKALLISLILSNARALAADYGAAPILLLDEVAAHLDADRRAALYGEIRALNAQAWMTGTGPELFAGLGGQAQRFEVTETSGVSEISEIK